MLKLVVRSLFKGIDRLKEWVEYHPKSEGTPNTPQKEKNHPFTIKNEQMAPVSTKRFKVVNLWDYLKFREGTQAHHITQATDFEEWPPMEEILRRVKELFGIEYQNERSLYPYLKTLVDSGLLDASVVGGKMRWKKKSLLVTVNEIEEEMTEEQMMLNRQPPQ